MIDVVASAEAAKYAEVWADPAYRRKAHGLSLWQNRRDLFPASVTSALDIGCGHGRLVAQWWAEGVDGHGVDIAPAAVDPGILGGNEDRFHFAALWRMDLGRRFPLGVCADVMEHIPEALVDLSLERIAVHCDLVLFKIAAFPSEHRGQVLHLTIRPVEWWHERLSRAFGVARRVNYPTDRREFVFRCLSD